MTEEEQVRAKNIAEKLEAERLKEEKEIAEQLEELKIRSLTKLARKLPTHTLTLYFPHMIDEEKRTCNAALKMLQQYDFIALMIIDQQEVTIKEEELTELFYNSTQNFPPKFMESITKQPCLVTLLLGIGGGGNSDSSVDQYLGVVEEKLGEVVYGQSKDPNNPAPNASATTFATQVDDEVWPGIWTPLNFLSKAAAVKILFPSVIRAIGFEDDKLPPPRYIMIFEATKAKEVNDLAEEFVNEVLKMGFFDSIDPETAKKVCKEITELDKLIPEKIKTTKMVLSLAKTSSDALLAFSQLGPIYISPDLKTGMKEADAFFPPEEEDEILASILATTEESKTGEEEVNGEKEEEGDDDDDDDEDDEEYDGRAEEEGNLRDEEGGAREQVIEEVETNEADQSTSHSTIPSSNDPIVTQSSPTDVTDVSDAVDTTTTTTTNDIVVQSE